MSTDIERRLDAPKAEVEDTDPTNGGIRMTQREIAKLMGLSERTIQRWDTEGGGHKPKSRPPTWKAVARLLAAGIKTVEARLDRLEVEVARLVEDANPLVQQEPAEARLAEVERAAGVRWRREQAEKATAKESG